MATPCHSTESCGVLGKDPLCLDRFFVAFLEVGSSWEYLDCVFILGVVLYNINM